MKQCADIDDAVDAVAEFLEELRTDFETDISALKSDISYLENTRDITENEVIELKDKLKIALEDLEAAENAR